MGQPVMHFEVLGRDGAMLREYFGQLFGWEFQEVGGPMDYATVDREQNLSPEGIGTGGGIGGSSEYEGHLTFYVGVDDAEAALAKAEELGGTRVSGPMEVPEARIMIGLLKDPEGHLVGVAEPLGDRR